SDFCTELLAETGIDTEYEQSGELELLFTEQSIPIARADERAGSNLNLDEGRSAYKLLSADEIRDVEPLIGPEILGALECRRTAQVRNPRLVRALAAACKRLGVAIHENAVARGFLRDGDRVLGVETNDRRFHAPYVVLAAGAWSSQLDPRLQELMPVHPVRGQMVLVKLPRRNIQRIISKGRQYLVPRRDGHVLIGSTEEPEAGFTQRITAKGVSGLLDAALRFVPSLADAPIVATWSGFRPATPDEKPHLGPVPGFDGLIAATGHFRAGVTLAPATAEVIAAMLLGQGYSIDLSCCQPGRNL
ncbi:MAG: FAD-dependent oxidoreductase, partial [Planctomycetota bacterium]